MDHFWCDPGVRRVSTGETPWGGPAVCCRIESDSRGSGLQRVSVSESRTGQDGKQHRMATSEWHRMVIGHDWQQRP